MSQQLKASVALSKTSIAIGDHITVVGRLRNVGLNPVTVFKRQRLYSTLHVKVFDKDHQPLTAFRLAIYEPTEVSREDFAEIRKDEEVTMSFNAVLTKQSILDIEKPGKRLIHGVFLNFENSAVLFRGKGRHEVRFEYEVSQEISEEWRKQFGLGAVWFGNVLSEPIDVHVR